MGKKKPYGTMKYLICIYALHIEEVDINKKFNVNLICKGVKLKSKSWKSQKKKPLNMYRNKS